MVDISEEQLAITEKEVAAYTSDLLALKCDVSSEADVNEVVRKAVERFGRIDILVNNAALWRDYRPFLEVPNEIWTKFFHVNVMSVVYFTKAVLGSMVERGFGRIINVASVAGVYGNANMAAYSASKGAVIAMTKAIAKEVAKTGVTVNCTSPGSVSSSKDRDENAFTESSLTHMGRSGTDAENASLICYLASEEASYINGQSIQIDGGRRLI